MLSLKQLHVRVLVEGSRGGLLGLLRQHDARLREVGLHKGRRLR